MNPFSETPHRADLVGTSDIPMDGLPRPVRIQPRRPGNTDHARLLEIASHPVVISQYTYSEIGLGFGGDRRPAVNWAKDSSREEPGPDNDDESCLCCMTPTTSSTPSPLMLDSPGHLPAVDSRFDPGCEPWNLDGYENPPYMAPPDGGVPDSPAMASSVLDPSMPVILPHPTEGVGMSNAYFQGRHRWFITPAAGTRPATSPAPGHFSPVWRPPSTSRLSPPFLPAEPSAASVVAGYQQAVFRELRVSNACLRDRLQKVTQHVDRVWELQEELYVCAAGSPALHGVVRELGHAVKMLRGALEGRTAWL